MKEKNTRKFDLYNDYPMNVMEAFIVLLIIQAILDKPINFEQITKSSLIIGVLISVATYFNEEFKDNVKQGLHYGVSSMIISQFAPIV